MPETEPAIQSADQNTGDDPDVDALLNEAAATAAEVKQEGSISTAVAETTPAAAAASTAEENASPAATNRGVSAAGGIGSGIEDLDALLAEVAQEPAPAGDESQPTASAAADQEVVETPAAVDAAEQPTGGAAVQEGDSGTNEVALLETRQAAKNTAAEGGSPQDGAQTTPDESAGADAADAADVQVSGLEILLRRLVCIPLGIVAVVLAILDAPFARLSPRIKTTLGYVGIATLAVASAVWFAGPAIMSH